MARVGSFSGATEYFGAPLAIVHPRDNKFPKYDPLIDESDLTKSQKRDYQRELEELFAALVLARNSDQ